MYRVELKERDRRGFNDCSLLFLMYRVELKGLEMVVFHIGEVLFLMYRVELKVGSGFYHSHQTELVPNVPCGVERSLWRKGSSPAQKFLMYRVELKGKPSIP